MRSRPFILRCAAFILILVFSQKTGTGLFLHNLLHSNTANTNDQQQEDENGKHFNYTCSCIDDFLMPFAETAAQDYAQPVFAFINSVTFFKEHFPFHTTIFSSLRGPPANWL